MKRITLTEKFDGSETHMFALLVDSYGSVKRVDMFADTQIEGADYFIPCNACGVAVLIDSIANLEACDHCSLPKTELPLNVRIEKASRLAIDSFYETLACEFPEITTGDMDPPEATAFEVNAFRTADIWITGNLPVIKSEPEDWAKEMNLTYADTWHMHHTGGGCMVVSSDNVVVDAEHRYLAISDECVCIYTDNFDDNWLMDPLCTWSFGDNPTVLMNYIDDFFGGSVLWDKGKLFQDIMLINILKLNIW